MSTDTETRQSRRLKAEEQWKLNKWLLTQLAWIEEQRPTIAEVAAKASEALKLDISESSIATHYEVVASRKWSEGRTHSDLWAEVRTLRAELDSHKATVLQLAELYQAVRRRNIDQELDPPKDGQTASTKTDTVSVQMAEPVA